MSWECEAILAPPQGAAPVEPKHSLTTPSVQWALSSRTVRAGSVFRNRAKQQRMTGANWHSIHPTVDTAALVAVAGAGGRYAKQRRSCQLQVHCTQTLPKEQIMHPTSHPIDWVGPGWSCQMTAALDSEEAMRWMHPPQEDARTMPNRQLARHEATLLPMQAQTRPPQSFEAQTFVHTAAVEVLIAVTAALMAVAAAHLPRQAPTSLTLSHPLATAHAVPPPRPQQSPITKTEQSPQLLPRAQAS